LPLHGMEHSEALVEKVPLPMTTPHQHCSVGRC
jgi:hypothetical protein